LSETKTKNKHRCKSFNLFSKDDTCLLRALSRVAAAVSETAMGLHVTELGAKIRAENGTTNAVAMIASPDSLL